MTAYWRSTKMFDDRSISICERAADTDLQVRAENNTPTNYAKKSTDGDCGLRRLFGIMADWGGGMNDERTAANMDVVLEEICSGLPHGGDHESRKFVAKKLMQSVKKGNVTLEGLRPVASRALSEVSSRKSA
jgi:hypothetical protein